MKYFSISSSIDLDVIGEYPQVSTTKDNCFETAFSKLRVNYGEIPEEIPFLELEFNKIAKKTDLLGTYNPYFGLIINSKIKKILKNFNLPPHKFYSINIINKDKKIPYYWFNFYDDIFQYINMNKSKFSIKKRDVIEKFSFKSKEFFLNKSKDIFLDFEKTIRIEKIHLLNSFPKYDLFDFESFIFISENLLKSLQENEITGFDFSELDYEVIVEK